MKGNKETRRVKRRRPSVLSARIGFMGTQTLINIATIWLAVLSSPTKLCAGWTGHRYRRYGFQRSYQGHSHRLYERKNVGDEGEQRKFYASKKSNALPNAKEQQNQMHEILQAERRAERDESFTYNPLELGQDKLPDLNPFKNQLENNAAGKTLSQSLAIPDFEKKSGVPSKETTGILESMDKSPSQEPTKTNAVPHEEEGAIETDGLYLAPDIYQRSRDMLHGDGSLDLGNTDDDMNSPDGGTAILEQLLESELEANQPLAIPKDTDENPGNMEDDWATIQKAQAQPFNASRWEELHQQVFVNEQGYLQQSDKFRQSLTDPTVAQKATYERRSAQFLKRQAKAMRNLDQSMKEFEEVLLQRQRPGPQTCSRCSIKLIDSDYDIAPQLWMRSMNLTRICQTCYIDLMKTAQNFQKLQPKKTRKGNALQNNVQTSNGQSRNSHPENLRSMAVENKNLPSNSPSCRKPATDSNGQAKDLPRKEVRRKQAIDREIPPSKSPIAKKPATTSNGRSRDWPSRRDSLEGSTVPKNGRQAGGPAAAASAAASSWTEMEDPDTGEKFYWNEEKDEMRWEL